MRQCRAEFVQVARSFWLIPEVIPPVARDDVALLYCLCRQLDDAVDEAPSSEAARAALDAFRRELSGEAEPRPLVAAFLAGARRARLPLECARDLLDGMAADLGPVRMADDDALVRYAYQVAASVGLMLAPLLGMEGAPAAHRVVDLAIALQLSNVLLGVAADAQRDRVYLPASRLAAAGLSSADVLRLPSDRRLRPVLQCVAELADQWYRSFDAAAALVPLRYRHGVMLLASAYRELGWRAVRRERTAAAPAGLPLRRRLAHLGNLFVRAWDPRTFGLLPPPPHDPTLHRALAGWRGAHA